MMRVVEVTLDHESGRLVLYGAEALNQRIRSIPGSRYSKALSAWTLPCTWPAMVALGTEVREANGLVKASDEVAEVIVRTKDTITRLTAAADARSKDPRPWGTELGLFAHQDDGAYWLASRTLYGSGPDGNGRLLLDQMGTGKTRTVLAATKLLANAGESPWPMLVVCPTTVKASWAAEIQAFLPGVEVSVVSGTAVQRRRQIARVSTGEAKILVIGWESLRLHSRLRTFPGQTIKKCPACGGTPGPDEVPEKSCQRHERELNQIPWAVQVADECHRAKNPTALMTQALWGVGESCRTGRKWALSGTLVANSPEDMWSVLHWVAPEAFPVKSLWVDRYCREEWNYAGYREIVGLRQERREELDRWFRPMRRRVIKAEALDLPEVQRGGTLVRWLDMDKEQAAAYVQMRDEMVAHLDAGRITATNGMTQVGRLMLLASACGVALPDPDSPTGVSSQMLLKMPSNKIQAFLEDLKQGDYGTSPLVVTMQSRRLLRLLESEMLKSDDLKRQGIVTIAGDTPERDRATGIQAFQAGAARFCLMTYGAGGVGITLTAADTMVLLQRSWSAIEMRQAIDRIHRIGSERHESISVIDYVTRDSVEMRQIAKVQDKERVLEDLVQDAQALRRFLLGQDDDDSPTPSG